MLNIPFKTMKIALGAVLIGAVSTSFAMAQDGFDPAKEVVTPAGTLEFVNINPAIQIAHAYGNRGAGAHGSFGKFPANFMTPVHIHTGAYHGVVVIGDMTNPFEGEENPSVMPAGSYWYVPAGMAHATACVSDTPCQFYFYADGAFDFHPVE